jgi:predicted dehydrogenase
MHPHALPAQEQAAQQPAAANIRVGIIGLDTSHAVAFTKLLNSDEPPAELANCRVVAAYPHGSTTIEQAFTRIPGYVEQMKAMDIDIVDSIDALLEQVDAVLLLTNDGQPRLDQALKVFKAGKPCFVDKPVAASLADVVAIFEAAAHYKTPVFSSSSLRYNAAVQSVRRGSAGEVLGGDTFGPAALSAPS